MDSYKARGIIYYDGKLLLVRNKSSENFWCLPGGNINQGESIVEALKRELVEETGIEPILGNLLYIHQIKGPNGYGIPEFLFHIQNGKDYLSLDISKSSHGELELAEIGFKELGSLNIMPKFLQEDIPIVANRRFEVPVQFKLSD